MACLLVEDLEFAFNHLKQAAVIKKKINKLGFKETFMYYLKIDSSLLKRCGDPNSPFGLECPLFSPIICEHVMRRLNTFLSFTA